MDRQGKRQTTDHGTGESPLDFAFEARQSIAQPLNVVFPFFCNERNLEAITPPWLRFRVVTKSTPEIKLGTIIEYRLRIRGIPIRWKSQITGWQPPTSFTDEQMVGPYQKWIHTHSFIDHGNRVEMIDRVTYRVPGGVVGRFLIGPLVRRDIESIFRYRKIRIEKLFP